MPRPKKNVSTENENVTIVKASTPKTSFVKAKENVKIGEQEFETYDFIKEVETPEGKQTKVLKAVKIL